MNKKFVSFKHDSKNDNYNSLMIVHRLDNISLKLVIWYSISKYNISYLAKAFNQVSWNSKFQFTGCYDCIRDTAFCVIDELLWRMCKCFCTMCVEMLNYWHFVIFPIELINKHDWTSKFYQLLSIVVASLLYIFCIMDRDMYIWVNVITRHLFFIIFESAIQVLTNSDNGCYKSPKL